MDAKLILSEIRLLRKDVSRLMKTKKRMDKHISFVEHTYDVVRAPFCWVANKLKQTRKKNNTVEYRLNDGDCNDSDSNESTSSLSSESTSNESTSSLELEETIPHTFGESTDNSLLGLPCSPRTHNSLLRDNDFAIPKINKKNREEDNDSVNTVCHASIVAGN